MDQEEKRNLTYMGNNDFFGDLIKKLSLNMALTDKEKEYILTCALIFLEYYNKDKRHKSYLEFAYFIILKYSTYYNDYMPLYDFSVNFGFYPIAREIINKNLMPTSGILHYFIDAALEKFKNESYIETYEQNKNRLSLLKNDSDEVGFIAPTSFGKSSVISNLIRDDFYGDKIGIIVPTKSLLMQTYRLIKEEMPKRKIIIHDEMYDDSKDDRFVGVLTQERAYRLIKKRKVAFDSLFIDEAHNLLKSDARNLLLTRLISLNKHINKNTKILYLSPLIENFENIKITEEQEIKEIKIKYNIKEPEIYEYRKNDNSSYYYNRFLNKFYRINHHEEFLSYIYNNSQKKNFIYIRNPRKIEMFAEYITNNLEHKESNELNIIADLLKENVHESFYAIEYFEKGVIYLHGKLPDLIKEYLESKFVQLNEITHLIANTVILEGMNLPIDTLFILNTYGLNQKELTNLIGRVNRLNDIFNNSETNMDKLLPKIHFVNNDKYDSPSRNMKSKIISLRSGTFEDEVKNPLLKEYDITKIITDSKKLKKIEEIKNNEEIIYESQGESYLAIKKYLLEENISEFYYNLDNCAKRIYRMIELIEVSDADFWRKLDVLEKVEFIFVKNAIGLNDFEIERLKFDEARAFYEMHIFNKHKYPLKQRINLMFNYFKTKSKTESGLEFYIGDSYGEISRQTPTYKSSKPVYINLQEKTDKQLVNLAIVKIKIEDDFVNYKLNKLITMLYDYELISENDYNKYIYGTLDANKISLYKLGFGGSLVNRLENDGQIDNIFFDEYGNIKTNDKFEEFKKNVDDFYRFEIERLI